MFLSIFLVFGFINFHHLAYKKKYRSQSLSTASASNHDFESSPKLVSGVCNTTAEYEAIINSSLGLSHVLHERYEIDKLVWKTENECVIHFKNIYDAKKVDDIIFEFCLDLNEVHFPNRVNNSVEISGSVCNQLIDYFYERNKLQTYFDNNFEDLI